MKPLELITHTPVSVTECYLRFEQKLQFNYRYSITGSNIQLDPTNLNLAFTVCCHVTVHAYVSLSETCTISYFELVQFQSYSFSFPWEFEIVRFRVLYIHVCMYMLSIKREGGPNWGNDGHDQQQDWYFPKQTEQARQSLIIIFVIN